MTFQYLPIILNLFDRGDRFDNRSSFIREAVPSNGVARLIFLTGEIE